MALEALGALVVGVSADKREIQMRFIDKFELTFPMIPDPGKLVIDAYGARGVLGVTAQRSTFLVDHEGLIARVWPKVSLEGHAQDVVDAIRELGHGAFTP
jgi:peroxiredoxin Q/BCP